MQCSPKLCTISPASGQYVVYLDDIDAFPATDMMPGAELVANAFILFIFWASQSQKKEKKKKRWMQIINPTQTMKIHKYVRYCVSRR